MIQARNIKGSTFGAFSRYINGSQTIAAWQETAIQVNNKDFDDIGCSYNSTTHKITISQGGIWVFNAGAGVVGTGANEFGGIGIKINGTGITSTRYRGNASFPAIGYTSTVAKVSSGDVVEATVAGSLAVTNSSRTYCNFSGACVHPYSS